MKNTYNIRQLCDKLYVTGFRIYRINEWAMGYVGRNNKIGLVVHKNEVVQSIYDCKYSKIDGYSHFVVVNDGFGKCLITKSGTVNKLVNSGLSYKITSNLTGGNEESKVILGLSVHLPLRAENPPEIYLINYQGKILNVSKILLEQNIEIFGVGDFLYGVENAGGKQIRTYAVYDMLGNNLIYVNDKLEMLHTLETFGGEK